MLKPGLLFLLITLVAFATDASAEDYFPPRGVWQKRSPAELGFDAARLQAAVDYALAHESNQNRETAADLKATFGKREPDYRIMGPTKPWEAMCGIIIKDGYVAAQWGPLDRVDMTHSVVKTFLTSTVGIAWDQGLIRDVHDRVGPYMPDESLFASEHNAQITWDHLLRQTSDWSGELWGVPDWADRPVGDTVEEMKNRVMHAPGTHFKYNDVRVNLLALAALHVWRDPLPVVLRDHIMNPIGASSTWRWHGYEDSWITVDGRKIQSVSGGGHFGGGMFINAWDQARFGYLCLRKGNWAGQQLLSREWIAQARTPTLAKPDYGYANWFLNHDLKRLPDAPSTSVMFLGNGVNAVYVDWANDLVIVVRWIQNGEPINAFVKRVIDAIDE